MPPPRPSVAPVPLDDHDLATLQALLDALPATLAPLENGMIDGYLCGGLVRPRRVHVRLPPLVHGMIDGSLCGVLVPPRPVPDERWLPHVLDAADEERPRSLPP